MKSSSHSLNLRVGEWVEVRDAASILATLDDRQSTDALPFMPEMLQHCGKRFQVFKSAHKTADTIELFSIRAMADAVHLENLRCDGACHGGCQARCLLFWKEAWLRRAEGPGSSAGPAHSPTANAGEKPEVDAATVLSRGTKHPTAPGEPERFRCQATEMLLATSPVSRTQRWDPRFYLKDLTSGNVSLFNFIRFGALAMLNAFLRRWFDTSIPRIRGLAGEKTPSVQLNLREGEWVRVRSKQDVMLTLNSRQRNRGMWFDAEMVRYCGRGNFRVLQVVRKLINEKTGQMVAMSNPCIILDGVTCTGNYLYQRMFSPRHEYMYFHEIWLERVSDSKSQANGS